jgi:hypothetical protein
MTIMPVASICSASEHVQAASDFRNLPVLDEDVPVRDVADLGIHRDDEAVADQKAFRAHALFSLVA